VAGGARRIAFDGDARNAEHGHVAPNNGPDADVFNFATDADNTQRAEIRIMQTMLQKEPSQEKR
jgi:hypothetical protein